MPPHLQCLQGRPAPTLVMLLPPAFSVADAAARGLLGAPAGRRLDAFSVEDAAARGLLGAPAGRRLGCFGDS